MAIVQEVLGYGQSAHGLGSSSLRFTATLVFSLLLLLVCCYVAWWLYRLPGLSTELQKEKAITERERQALAAQQQAFRQQKEQERNKLDAEKRALQRVSQEMKTRQQRTLDSLAMKHGTLQDLVNKRTTTEGKCARFRDTLVSFPNCEVTKTALKTLEEQAQDLSKDEQEWRSILSDPLYSADPSLLPLQD